MNGKKNLSFYFLKKYLFSKRSSSIVKVISYISLSTISLAFFAFLLVLSVMKGLKESSVSRYLKAEPHLEVIVPSPKDQRISLLDKILQDKNVKKYYIFEKQDVLVKNSEGLLSGVKAIGFKRKDLIDFFSKKEDKDLAKSLSKKEILMGGDIAYTHNFLEGETLEAFPLEVALYPQSEVPLSESISIKGFFSLEVPEIDGTTIFYVLNETFSSLRSTKSNTIGVHVKLKDPYKYEELEKSIKTLGLKVSSWKERNSDFFFSLQLESLVMTVFFSSYRSFGFLFSFYCFITTYRTKTKRYFYFNVFRSLS